MQFETFLQSTSKIEKIELTKEEVHLAMVPEFRKTFAEDYRKSTTRNAAVMPIIYPKDEAATLIFIQRQTYDGAHSGQIAFAGGKEEKEDNSFLETAFREVQEEIGIAKSQLRYLKKLHSLYIPPSDFRVYPYLSISETPLNFKLQEEEVAGILEIPVASLLNENSKLTMEIENKKNILSHVPTYTFGSHIIWGATAMILHEVELLLRYSLKV